MSRRSHVVVGTAADTTVTVIRTSAAGPRPQGLVLDADEPLSVDDIDATRIVLWDHTAPTEVAVHTSGPGELRIWNVWRDGDLLQAWMNDAGIEVDDDGEDLGLRCHDGHGGDDPVLEVRIAFDRAWTQPADA